MDPHLSDMAKMEIGAKADGMLFGTPFIVKLRKNVGSFSSLNKVEASIKKVFSIMIDAYLPLLAVPEDVPTSVSLHSAPFLPTNILLAGRLAHFFTLTQTAGFYKRSGVFK